MDNGYSHKNLLILQISCLTGNFWWCVGFWLTPFNFWRNPGLLEKVYSTRTYDLCLWVEVYWRKKIDTSRFLIYFTPCRTIRAWWLHEKHHSPEKFFAIKFLLLECQWHNCILCCFSPYTNTPTADIPNENVKKNMDSV